MICENVFEEIYKESKSFMSDQADKFEFPQLAVTRSRTKRKQTDENARDKPITDPKLKFQIDSYFGTLYAAITAIENHFNSTSQNILRDISLFSKNRLNQVKNGKLPADAFCTLCNLYQKFIDRTELCNEYTQFAKLFFDFEKIIKLPKNIYPSTSNNNSSDSESSLEVSSSGEETNNLQTQKDFLIRKAY